jgi:hypothetical protein
MNIKQVENLREIIKAEAIVSTIEKADKDYLITIIVGRERAVVILNEDGTVEHKDLEMMT